MEVLAQKAVQEKDGSQIGNGVSLGREQWRGGDRMGGAVQSLVAQGFGTQHGARPH